MGQKHPKEQSNYYRPNFWGMVRDIIIASINKGQFLLMGGWLIIFVLILKVDSNEASHLLRNFKTLLIDLRILGWSLSGITIVGWYFNLKFVRRSFHREMNRISREKKEYQEKQLGYKLDTSNN